MNMNERSTLGNTYRALVPGKNMRTGLSRRKGGLRSGSLVCCLAVIFTLLSFCFLPGSEIFSITFPNTLIFDGKVGWESADCWRGPSGGCGLGSTGRGATTVS